MDLDDSPIPEWKSKRVFKAPDDNQNLLVLSDMESVQSEQSEQSDAEENGRQDHRKSDCLPRRPGR
jgi:hypothetical protein